MVLNPPAMQETQEIWVWSLLWKDPLEEDMVTHFSILAQKIVWTEKPGQLESMGSQRIKHHWAHVHAHTHAHMQRLHIYCMYVSICILVQKTCGLNVKYHSRRSLDVTWWSKDSICRPVWIQGLSFCWSMWLVMFPEDVSLGMRQQHCIITLEGECPGTSHTQMRTSWLLSRAWQWRLSCKFPKWFKHTLWLRAHVGSSRLGWTSVSFDTDRKPLAEESLEHKCNDSSASHACLRRYKTMAGSAGNSR